MLVKAPSQLIGTLVQLLGMPPAGFLVDNVLCLANDLLGLFWMLTCDFSALLTRFLKFHRYPLSSQCGHRPPSGDNWLPVAWRRYSRRTRSTQPAEESS